MKCTTTSVSVWPPGTCLTRTSSPLNSKASSPSALPEQRMPARVEPKREAGVTERERLTYLRSALICSMWLIENASRAGPAGLM